MPACRSGIGTAIATGWTGDRTAMIRNLRCKNAAICALSPPTSERHPRFKAARSEPAGQDRNRIPNRCRTG
ncbi:hypothetical protein A6A40_14710 [Azospirillum humicireducens]|uniref:Uncharacterized protein n=1 Tax=Azospirillum humicireducens TaxID=1226968 RepID=A0A2R4VPJ8_9PROT|nr:hypothetical protein A6A40_14710 [Azospirillum humicireducens]